MADEIDPQLPFIQLHRSLIFRATQLAPMLNLSAPQVIGGLVLFWMTLADRRVLAKHSPASGVVLPAAEVAGRLQLALGLAQVPALEAFVLAGLLEPKGDGYRVRGMSLYLDAEATRIAKKRRSHSSATPVPPKSHPTEVRGERREVKGDTGEGETQEVKTLHETGELPGMPKPPPKARKRSVGQQIYDRFQALRSDYLTTHGGQCRPDEEEPHPAAINTWAQKFLDHLGGGPDRPNLPEDVDPVDLAAKAIEEWIPRAEWSVAKGLPFKHLLTDKTREEVVAGYLRNLGLESESAA